MWTFPSFESVWRDIRYAMRTLWRTPGFTVVAVLALAVGIGANTAIYSLVDAVFVRGLPYPASDRLMVLIGNVRRAAGVERRGTSYPDFADWRAQAKSFEDLALYTQGNASSGGFVGSRAHRDRSGLGAVLSRCSASRCRLAAVFAAEEDQVAGRDAVVVLERWVVAAPLWRRSLDRRAHRSR